MRDAATSRRQVTDPDSVLAEQPAEHDLSELLEELKRRPVHTLQDVTKVTGLSFPAAASGMAVLEQLTIAREITGKQRNRVFAYAAYLVALQEGTENL